MKQNTKKDNKAGSFVSEDALMTLVITRLKDELVDGVREMLSEVVSELAQTEPRKNAPVWATRRELAERLNCQPSAIDSYLVAAEESGKVKVLRMSDGFKKRSVKRYNIAQFEKYYTIPASPRHRR